MSPSGCPHSRKIFAALDMELAGSLEEHVRECTVCREVRRRVRGVVLQVSRSVPSGKLDLEERREMENSLNSLLSRMRKGSRSPFRFLPWG